MSAVSGISANIENKMASEHGAIERAPGDGRIAKARLVSTDAANPREYVLDQPTISVGSHRSNDIVLGAETVSRRHAMLTRELGRFTLSDLGSTNGTFVNGRRIQSPVALKRGDNVRFGSIKFAFTSGADAMPIAPWRTARMAGAIAVLAAVFAAGFFGVIYRNDLRQIARSIVAKDSSKQTTVPSTVPSNVPFTNSETTNSETTKPEAVTAPPSATSANPIAAGPGWLARLNYYRAMLNLTPVVEDPTLSKGDRAHAMYIVKNYADAIQHTGLGAEMHEEDPGNKWFTPAGLEAAKASDMEAWYMRGASSENDPSASSDPAEWAAARGPGTDAWTIDGWIAIPFHRMPILNPRLVRAGFGTYCESGACASGLNLKNGSADTLPPGATVKWPIAFPPDGSTIEMGSFGNEWPDPRASCRGYETPSGLGITLELTDFSDTQLGDFSVTRLNADGTRSAIEACGFDSRSYTNPDTAVKQLAREILKNYAAVVVIPRRPLAKGGKYEVSITADGRRYNWTFSIT